MILQADSHDVSLLKNIIIPSPDRSWLGKDRDASVTSNVPIRVRLKYGNGNWNYIKFLMNILRISKYDIENIIMVVKITYNVFVGNKICYIIFLKDK